jgi:hypothetical protein
MWPKNGTARSHPFINLQAWYLRVFFRPDVVRGKYFLTRN